MERADVWIETLAKELDFGDGNGTDRQDFVDMVNKKIEGKTK